MNSNSDPVNEGPNPDDIGAALLGVVTDALPTAIAYVDRNRVYRYANSSYLRAVRQSASDVIGKSIDVVVQNEWLSDETMEKIHDRVARALNGMASEFSFRATLPATNEEIWLLATYTPDIDPAGRVRGYVSLFRDITEEKALESKLQERATTDPLTGLRNRRFLEDVADQKFADAERHSRTMGLLMIDVDLFKSFNDRHGHAVGDEILCRIGKAISDSLRQEDIVTRWGGEEFLALLNTAGEHQVILAAERIRQSVEGLHLLPDALPHPVTVSIGVSLCGDDPAQLDRDIVTADKALYTAKKNGRNRVEISPRFSDPGAAHRQESIRTG
ncbi:MAG: GGDEF domain-containing protein [Rhodospirillales bacterium]